MDKKYRPSGVADLVEYKFSDSTMSAIRKCLRNNKKISKENKDNPDFIKSLELASSRFAAESKIHGKNKPSDIVRNLERALNSARTYKYHVKNLDTRSRLFIKKVSNADSIGYVENIETCIEYHTNILMDAHKLAKQLPQKGSLVQYYKLLFVRDIARVIKKHLDLKPTSTKGGLFESVVKILLEDITGKKHLGLHSLIEKVLAAEKI